MGEEVGQGGWEDIGQLDIQMGGDFILLFYSVSVPTLFSLFDCVWFSFYPIFFYPLNFNFEAIFSEGGVNVIPTPLPYCATLGC